MVSILTPAAVPMFFFLIDQETFTSGKMRMHAHWIDNIYIIQNWDCKVIKVYRIQTHLIFLVSDSATTTTLYFPNYEFGSEKISCWSESFPSLARYHRSTILQNADRLQTSSNNFSQSFLFVGGKGNNSYVCLYLVVRCHDGRRTTRPIRVIQECRG